MRAELQFETIPCPNTTRRSRDRLDESSATVD